MEKKIEPSDIGPALSLDRCIKTVSQILERSDEKVKRARTPYNKSLAKHSQEFYKAILYHLNKLKNHEQA
jgi:hypothetical protein